VTLFADTGASLVDSEREISVIVVTSMAMTVVCMPMLVSGDAVDKANVHGFDSTTLDVSERHVDDVTKLLLSSLPARSSPSPSPSAAAALAVLFAVFSKITIDFDSTAIRPRYTTGLR